MTIATHEYVFSFLCAFLGSVLGAVGAFYALRQRVIDLENMVLRRLTKLETEGITVTSCNVCKIAWGNKFDGYDKNFQTLHVNVGQVNERLEHIADRMDAFLLTLAKYSMRSEDRS